MLSICRLPEPYDCLDRPERDCPSNEEINRAVQLVRAYLILYRSPGNLTPAPSLKVLEVEAGSNALQAGIQRGDFLESYDGKRPASIKELRAAIQDAKMAGRQRVGVVILRGKEQ